MNNEIHHYDIKKIRSQFPLLHRTINEHPLVYLDNAATTQKPQSVIDAMVHYYTHTNANVHRSIHSLGEEATQAFEDARSKVQHFLHAKSPKECVFVRGTTEAINLVANSFVAPRILPGEQILLSEMEHHSNIVPWQLICKKTGAVLRVIPVTEAGELDLNEFYRLLSPETKFLSIGHVSNALGTINPIKEMIDAAHAQGVRVLIDGAQAGAHLSLNVQELDCDFYTLSAHKMYGPTGIGILYGKAELLDSMTPYQGGGEMITHVTFELTEYQGIPHRFEAGTPNIAGAIGFGATVDFLNKIHLKNIHAYEEHLLAYAKKALEPIKHMHFIGTAHNKVPIISFIMGDVHAHDIGTILNSMGIAIRSGHHCAMPLMERLDVAATARISLGLYNTTEDIDRLVTALNKVEEVFD